MLKDLLVGSTGFVGGNVRSCHDFDAVCHSLDVKQYYGSKPDVCIYAGIPAAMFLANSAPEKDLQVMQQARENLRQIAPKQIVLISTIAVFGDSRRKQECSEPVPASAYGQNRLQLERWIMEDFPKTCVIRLPALYGTGLKKNFLYDMHTIIPQMLKTELFRELARNVPLLENAYTDGGKGFFHLRSDCDRLALRDWFRQSDFNALCFTDSRSRFQFYGLSRLWSDIQTALSEQLELVHLCTPPVSASEVYRAVNGSDWTHEIKEKPPFDYDLQSLYSERFGGSDGYLCTKEQELEQICRFMKRWKEDVS